MPKGKVYSLVCFEEVQAMAPSRTDLPAFLFIFPFSSDIFLWDIVIPISDGTNQYDATKSFGQREKIQLAGYYE